MIKKLMLAVATLVASMGFAFAQVDVNKADAAALDSAEGRRSGHVEGDPGRAQQGRSVQGLGRFPEAREGCGRQERRPAVEAGLQVNGQARDGAPMAAAPADKTAKPAKAGAKPADAKARPEAKPEAAKSAT